MRLNERLTKTIELYQGMRLQNDKLSIIIERIGAKRNPRTAKNIHQKMSGNSEKYNLDHFFPSETSFPYETMIGRYNLNDHD